MFEDVDDKEGKRKCVRRKNEGGVGVIEVFGWNCF